MDHVLTIPEIRALIETAKPGPCPDCEGTGEVYSNAWASWNMAQMHWARTLPDAVRLGSGLVDAEREYERAHPVPDEPETAACATCGGTGAVDLRAQLVARLPAIVLGLCAAIEARR